MEDQRSNLTLLKVLRSAANGDVSVIFATASSLNSFSDFRFLIDTFNPFVLQQSILELPLKMEELSPFTPKIGTNYAATSEEAERITAFLSRPVSKLQQLQAEIIRIKARYEDLVEQHLALSREIDAHRALIAPIRRVPTDILREIFLHCLPTKHNAVISSSECPILLTRICSGWRHIALNTAMLWASIHVPIPVCSLPERNGGPSTSPSMVVRLHKN